MLKIIQIIQEEYREAHLDGESQSPYVAICTNPQVGVFQRINLRTFSYIQELVVKFPMKGEHKIFKLESNLHNAAKKTAKKGPAV